LADAGFLFSEGPVIAAVLRDMIIIAHCTTSQQHTFAQLLKLYMQLQVKHSSVYKKIHKRETVKGDQRKLFSEEFS
jgi:hypothetical protein